MRTNKGITPIIGALVLIAIVVCVSFVVVVVTNPDLLSLGGEDVTTPYDGDLKVTITESNFLDRGAAVTTTSDKYSFYSSGGDALSSATSADFIAGKDFTVGTEKTVSIAPADLGKFWIYADPGTDFFLNPDATKEANVAIVAYERIDVDDDNNDEYVFEVDESSTKEKLTTPTREYTMVLCEEDSSLALNSPADQDSTGTGTQTGKIEWQLTIDEQYAARIARVYITSNETTFQSMIDLESISITGISVSSIDADSPNWEADMNINNYREPLDTKLVMIEEDPATSYVAITVKWESYFAADTEAVTLTLNVVTMGADESVNAAITDVVMIHG